MWCFRCQALFWNDSHGLMNDDAQKDGGEMMPRVRVRSPSLLQLAIDNTNPKPSLEVCRHHIHPEIWPLLPVRHQETQQQPSTLDSTAPCFHLGRTTRYHLHSRVVRERRRLSPSLSNSVVHSTIFAPAPAFQHPASAKPHSAGRRSSFSSCCCRILHRLQSSSPSSDCHFLYCVCFLNIYTTNMITWNERNSQKKTEDDHCFCTIAVLELMMDYIADFQDGKENGAEKGYGAATSALGTMDRGKRIAKSEVPSVDTSGLLPHEKSRDRVEPSDSEGELEPLSPLNLSERDEEEYPEEEDPEEDPEEEPEEDPEEEPKEDPVRTRNFRRAGRKKKKKLVISPFELCKSKSKPLKVFRSEIIQGIKLIELDIEMIL
ncbi:hypothetical protein LXL04_014842 [Taraxacum kok-saghyz]